MIAIIDYGMGNIASIQNMYLRLGQKDVICTSDISLISQAEKLILPGVGAFDKAMFELKTRNLIDVLNQLVLVDKVPVLGICLGMQLLAKQSEEGSLNGLGWLNAELKKFRKEDAYIKIPHMGWNYVRILQENALIELKDKPRFYFVHSFYMSCEHETDILGVSNYGKTFPSFVGRENIWGVQFHPEKSHRFGMQLLKNYAAI